MDLEVVSNEILLILRQTARRGSTITYTELVGQIKSARFSPTDPNLFKILCDISEMENTRGRGMLSAVVIRKHDLRPGQGFFDLARKIGFRFKDDDKFWTEQLKFVFSRGHQS